MSRNEPAPKRTGTKVGQARAQRAKLGAQANIKNAMIIEKWEDN